MVTATTSEAPVQTFRDVALERFNQVKTTSKEYFDVSKNYVKENPLLSVFLAGSALITSLPLFFVVSTFLFILLGVSSVLFVALSIMATMTGIVLFVPVTVTLATLVFYYTLYYLAYNTYSKVAVTLSEDQEATFSIKLVVDCLIKTVKEYGEHVRKYYNKVVNFVIEKLSVLKIQELTKNVNHEIKTRTDEVMQKLRSLRANKSEAAPEQVSKKEE